MALTAHGARRRVLLRAPAVSVVNLSMQRDGGYSFGPPPPRDGEKDQPRNDRLPSWERGDDGTVPQAVEDKVILDILSDREVARRRKDFDEADRLRDQLLGDYMIHVDDRSPPPPPPPAN